MSSILFRNTLEYTPRLGRVERKLPEGKLFSGIMQQAAQHDVTSQNDCPGHPRRGGTLLQLACRGDAHGGVTARCWQPVHSLPDCLLCTHSSEQRFHCIIFLQLHDQLLAANLRVLCPLRCPLLGKGFRSSQGFHWRPAVKWKQFLLLTSRSSYEQL